VVVAHAIESGCNRTFYKSHDGPYANLASVRAGANLAPVRAGECQFPPHQPHSAPAGDAVRRLAQPSRAAAGAGSVDRPVAAVLGSGLERSQEDAFPQHARLLYPRTQGRCASDRSGGGHPGQPVRRHRRRLRRHRRHAPLPGQGLSLHAGGFAVRSRSGPKRTAMAAM